MRNGFLVLLLSIILLQLLEAHGLAIKIDTLDHNAILELVATDKGVLIPRLTTIDQDAIAGLGAAQERLLIFNSTISKLNYWDITAWVLSPTNISSNWSLTGIGTTVNVTNFIGTIDNIPFNISVNSQNAAFINSLSIPFGGFQFRNSNRAFTNAGETIGNFALFRKQQIAEEAHLMIKQVHSFYSNISNSLNSN